MWQALCQASPLQTAPCLLLTETQEAEWSWGLQPDRLRQSLGPTTYQLSVLSESIAPFGPQFPHV